VPSSFLFINLCQLMLDLPAFSRSYPKSRAKYMPEDRETCELVQWTFKIVGMTERRI
jgi:hypothetical protein